jgi:Zn-dependent peptidase ImmA (M78 family)
VLNLDYILKYEVTINGCDWTIDVDALGDFLSEIEVSLPITIKTHAKCKYRYGTHYIRDNAHLIILNPNLSRRSANETLLHEIAHAWQTEKACPDNPAAFYARHYKGNGYVHNKWEIHAQAFARQFAHVQLVV